MNDSLDKILNDIRGMLENLQRNFRNARRRRNAADKTQLRVAVGECMQNLMKCKVSLARNAVLQAADVRSAMKIGADTEPQKQILRESALGYLIADEAIFALRTIIGYDDLNQAYTSMENIIKRVNDADDAWNASGTAKLRKDSFGVKRTVTADITSRRRLEQHRKMIDSFFVELIRTGELERLIEEAREKVYEESLAELEALADEPDVAETGVSDAADVPEPDAADVPEPDVVDVDEPEPVVKAKPKSAGRMFSKPEPSKTRKG